MAAAAFLFWPGAAAEAPGDPPLPHCWAEATLLQWQAGAGCTVEPPDRVTCTTVLPWGYERPGVEVGSGHDLCDVWVRVDGRDLVGSIDCSSTRDSPPSRVWCGTHEAYTECAFDWAARVPPLLRHGQCTTTSEAAGWRSGCTYFLTPGDLAGGYACGFTPPPDGTIHCFPAESSLIDEPWLSHRSGNCGTSLRFSGAALLDEEWVHCDVPASLPPRFTCTMDPPWPPNGQYPGPREVGCVLDPTNPRCHIDGQEYPGVHLDCSSTLQLQWPPSSVGCRGDPVEAYCTPSAADSPDPRIPTRATCTAGVEDWFVVCAAWVADADGWTGVDCIAGHPALYQAGPCSPPPWGLHTDDIVVGGQHACNAGAKARPDGLVPDCDGLIQPTIPTWSFWLRCESSPVTLACSGSGLPSAVWPPSVTARTVRCDAAVEDSHGSGDWHALCLAYVGPEPFEGSAAACRVEGDGVDCTVAVWLGPGIPPQCTIEPPVDLDCNMTLQEWPPSSVGCRGDPVEAYCTFPGGGPVAPIPTSTQCTVRVGVLLGSCAAWLHDSDGWTGVDCIAGAQADWFQCSQGSWGIHEDDYVVGGYHGCNFVAKARPEGFIPDCWMIFHPGIPNSYFIIHCDAGPVQADCVGTGLPGMVWPPQPFSPVAVWCDVHVDDTHGSGDWDAHCDAQAVPRPPGQSGAWCHVKGEHVECTVGTSVWQPSTLCRIDPPVDLDCYATADQFPPSFAGCRGDPVEAYCTSAPYWISISDGVRGETTCVVRADNVIAVCRAWAGDDDGWTGAYCIAGTQPIICPAVMPPEEDGIVVWTGCGILVMVQPDWFIPDCEVIIHPGWKSECSVGPATAECRPTLSPLPPLPPSLDGTFQMPTAGASCTIDVQDWYDRGDWSAQCAAQYGGAITPTGAGCRVTDGEGIDCTVAVWLGPSIPPHCEVALPLPLPDEIDL